MKVLVVCTEAMLDNSTVKFDPFGIILILMEIICIVFIIQHGVCANH